MTIKIKKNKGKVVNAKDGGKAETVLKTNEETKNKIELKPFMQRITFAADVILKQKFTDEDIREKVDTAFPAYPGSPVNFTQKEMGRARWALRNDKLTTRKKLEEGTPFGRLFNVEGKLVARENVPKKARSAKSKLKKEDDLLNNVAGINVHKKVKVDKTQEEETQEQPQKKAKVKTSKNKAQAVLDKIKKSKEKKKK